MHRFRKRSDAKRGLLVLSQTSTELDEPSSSFQLPEPASFRTSLILPSLTRRFSVLRSSTGDPLSVDVLRERLALQRANGSANQITEQEEEAILEELGRIREESAAEQEPEEQHAEDPDPGLPEADFRTSTFSNMTSTSTTSPSAPSPPSGGRKAVGRPSKRYSNNLFGSNRLQDQTYLRSVASNSSVRHRGGSGHSAVSLTQTESSSFSSLRPNDSVYSDMSARPTTPEERYSSNQSPPSSPRDASQSAPATTTYFDSPVSAAEYRLSKTLGPSNLRRASMALEEVIKEIEEEAEDEILVPRSGRKQDYHQFDTGTAISSDKQMYIDAESQRASPVPYGRPGTTSPADRLPGYIPGMARPMTPRESMDSEDIRSHSTTPRAASPFSPQNGHLQHSSSSSSKILRRGSDASRHSPRTASPRFERLGSDEQQQEGSQNSPFYSRRSRPASPLSGPTYQSMSVPSRPQTPSNVVWTNTPASSSSGHDTHGHSVSSAHSRNGSWVSTASASVDVHGQNAAVVDSNLKQAKSQTRSLRSPALPDSPTFDHNPSSMFGWSSPGPGAEPQSKGLDLGSPILIQAPAPLNRAMNSSTPTQNAPQSPAEAHRLYGTPPPTSRRSSRQNTPSSPFTLGTSPPLVLSSMANSSRSSLESAGSSYHSWEGGRKDITVDLYNGFESPAHPWYASSAEGTPADGWDTEDAIGKYAGLTKADFLAIQEKLVGAAADKATVPENRERAPSSLRKRRPSTSQSNYSTANYSLNGREVPIRVASPPPQALGSPRSATFEQSIKASALLDAMVKDLPQRSQTPVEPPPTAIEPVDPEEVSRRNRDLAQAIFGGAPSRSPPQTPDMSKRISPPVASPETLSPTSSPALSRNPSTPRDQEVLTREVQRRADAANVALRKSPSHSKIHDVSALPKKRVNPNQISSPLLVSASTSVDTIPLQSLQLASGSKLSLRIKKLRGTLRTKPPVTPGEEITPYPFSLTTSGPSSPPHTQTVDYHPPAMGAGAASAIELGGFKTQQMLSPPASAGPGLKGFMSRFRKTRAADLSPEKDRRGPPPFSPGYPSASAPPQQDSFSLQHHHLHPQSPSPKSPLLDDFPRPPPLQTLPSGMSSFSGTLINAVPTPSSPISEDAMAIKQLYDAASNLGLDRSAINELLVRSTSVSSRATNWTMLTRNNTTDGISSRLEGGERTRPPAMSEGRPSMDARAAAILDRSRSASERRPSVDNYARPSVEQYASTSMEEPTVQKLIPRRNTSRSDDNMAVNSVVLRRTIIIPSDGKSMAELQALLRKPSAKGRRRSESAASLQSGKSVHERAPTPPPSKSPHLPRFATENSPPLPDIPHSFISAGSLAPPHALASNLPGSYDSLYESYDDVKHSDAIPSEVGTAVEVIETADGQTIWSIVNGLRDDDTDSLFNNNRASFASEYSARSVQDGVQVFFKEHGRTGSKGSNASFVSRKKPPQIKTRPETKVFYTDSTKISRLIENLSRDQEAGSFNFLPTPSPTGPKSFHSQATGASDHQHWTVEERLSHMLGTMATSSS